MTAWPAGLGGYERLARRFPGSRDATRQELLKPGSLAPCHTEPRPPAQLSSSLCQPFSPFPCLHNCRMTSRLRASQTNGLQTKHLATESPTKKQGPAATRARALTALSELLPAPTPEASTAVLPVSPFFLDLRKMQQPGRLSRVWLVPACPLTCGPWFLRLPAAGHLGRGPVRPQGHSCTNLREGVCCHVF